jgi:hypothetical protein
MIVFLQEGIFCFLLSICGITAKFFIFFLTLKIREISPSFHFLLLFLNFEVLFFFFFYSIQLSYLPLFELILLVNSIIIVWKFLSALIITILFVYFTLANGEKKEIFGLFFLELFNLFLHFFKNISGFFL